MLGDILEVVKCCVGAIRAAPSPSTRRTASPDMKVGGRADVDAVGEGVRGMDKKRNRCVCPPCSERFRSIQRRVVQRCHRPRSASAAELLHFWSAPLLISGGGTHLSRWPPSKPQASSPAALVEACCTRSARASRSEALSPQVLAGSSAQVDEGHPFVDDLSILSVHQQHLVLIPRSLLVLPCSPMFSSSSPGPSSQMSKR